MTSSASEPERAASREAVWLVARRIVFVTGAHVDVSIKCCPDEESSKSTVRTLTMELQALGQAEVRFGGVKMPLNKALSHIGISSIGYVVTRLPLEGIIARPAGGLIIAPS